ncbi:MAG: PQQ-binding-like beta-propeller repeat protein, partial [Phycisphaerae bacterium]
MSVCTRLARLFVAFTVAALGGPLSPLAWAEDLKVDVSTATAITLPAAGDAPVAFKTPDGKEGWVRRLSNETIPTPAYAKGRIFVGGGYSSKTFLALESGSGKTLWSVATQDNGPTAPVVEAPYVAYNTESCHTEVRDSDSGELVWSEV